jgi:predicted transcriptional regulator
MQKPPGELELETLRYIAEHAPITVGEVAAQFGEPRGLARTTILTTMERLRAKGYLTRHAERGVFRYAPRTPQEVVMKDIVRDFVEKTLGGSLTPFVAYLSEADDLSEAEIGELRRLVETLQAGKETGNP